MISASQIDYLTQKCIVIFNKNRTICSFEASRSKLLLGSSKEKAMSLKAISFFNLSLDLWCHTEKKKSLYIAAHITYSSMQISWGKTIKINHSPLLPSHLNVFYPGK